MNLVEHMTGTLGSVDSFSIAASAAAVAEAAYLTRGAGARVGVQVSVTQMFEGPFSVVPTPNFAIKKVILLHFSKSTRYAFAQLPTSFP